MPTWEASRTQDLVVYVGFALHRGRGQVLQRKGLEPMHKLCRCSFRGGPLPLYTLYKTWIQPIAIENLSCLALITIKTAAPVAHQLHTGEVPKTLIQALHPQSCHAPRLQRANLRTQMVKATDQTLGFSAGYPLFAMPLQPRRLGHLPNFRNAIRNVTLRVESLEPLGCGHVRERKVQNLWGRNCHQGKGQLVKNLTDNLVATTDVQCLSTHSPTGLVISRGKRFFFATLESQTKLMPNPKRATFLTVPAMSRFKFAFDFTFMAHTCRAVMFEKQPMLRRAVLDLREGAHKSRHRPKHGDNGDHEHHEEVPHHGEVPHQEGDKEGRDEGWSMRS